jgi:hypothetical protein
MKILYNNQPPIMKILHNNQPPRPGRGRNQRQLRKIARQVRRA